MKNLTETFKRYLGVPQKGLRAGVMAANYYMGNYRDVIWLIGDGRSGTTWVCDLINWNKKYREMLEPFHPKWVRGMEGFFMHQYIKPDNNDNYFINTASNVFSGNFFRNSRIDSQNNRLLYRGLMIKDIFANLFIAWVHNHFPHVRKVLLLRHPFAVALSKLKTKNWNWMNNPKQFLSQEALYEDYLEPFDDIIRGVSNDYFERQVLIWAILHYVPFRQLKKGQVYILFYEELYSNPELELLLLFHYLYGEQNTHLDKKLLSQLNTKSRYAGKKSNIAPGKSPITAWQNELSSKQIDSGIKILEHFGLDKLYGHDSMPTTNNAEKLLEGH